METPTCMTQRDLNVMFWVPLGQIQEFGVDVTLFQVGICCAQAYLVVTGLERYGILRTEQVNIPARGMECQEPLNNKSREPEWWSGEFPA